MVIGAATDLGRGRLDELLGGVPAEGAPWMIRREVVALLWDGGELWVGGSLESEGIGLGAEGLPETDVGLEAWTVSRFLVDPFDSTVERRLLSALATLLTSLSSF